MPNDSCPTRRRTQNRIYRLAVALSLLLAMIWIPAASTAQEQPTPTSQCFVVADGYLNIGDPIPKASDTLAYLRLQTGEAEPVAGRIPNLTTTTIEAIAFKPNTADLYAANGNRLGIIDLMAPTFTALPNTFGASGTQQFNDVDGLSFDPLSGDLWGVNVNPAQLDVLFKINTTTGEYIPSAFTDPNDPTGKVDYLTIQSGALVDDVDDIAIDPVDGTMYAIVTSYGGIGSLAIINTTDGSITRKGDFTRRSSGAALQEVEGLGFSSDGQLYGSTGDMGNAPNLLWRIDKNSGVSTLIGQFDERLIDIEALDCLGSSGFVVFESYVNDVDADTAADAVTVSAGDPISRTYLIRNTGAYPLSNVKVLDDNGTPDDAADDITVCQDLSVSVGQSATCQRMETARQGQQRHVATVTAEDSLNNAYKQEDVTYYIGYEGAAVGGRVWRDSNGNGILDPVEETAGIAGVTVSLYTDTGVAITNTQTTNDGHYLFNNLQPGSYILGVQLPQLFDFTLKDKGADDTVDSDFEPDVTSADFGRTPIFSLVDGVIDQSWDAGLLGQVNTSSISGYVWNDLNGDGIQNDGEPVEVGVAGVTVSLQEVMAPSSQATVIQARTTQAITSTITLADGSYRFTDILAGDYIVEVTAPEGATFTQQNQGDSELIDSDVNPSTGQTGIFEVAANTEESNIDAGLQWGSFIYLPGLSK